VKSVKITLFIYVVAQIEIERLFLTFQVNEAGRTVSIIQRSKCPIVHHSSAQKL